MGPPVDKPVVTTTEAPVITTTTTEAEIITTTEAKVTPTIIDTNCKENAGDDFRGTVSVTRNGYTCQRWDADVNSAFELVNTINFRPENREHNYCRNPDNDSGGEWCYTTDSSATWDYCNIDICADETTQATTTEAPVTPAIEHGIKCKQNADDVFRGDVNDTARGFVCQRWDADINSDIRQIHPINVRPENIEHNFCRNPDNDSNGEWCYTTDPDKTWDYCNIKVCADETTQAPATEAPTTTEEEPELEIFKRIYTNRYHVGIDLDLVDDEGYNIVTHIDRDADQDLMKWKVNRLDDPREIQLMHKLTGECATVDYSTGNRGVIILTPCYYGYSSEWDRDQIFIVQDAGTVRGHRVVRIGNKRTNNGRVKYLRVHKFGAAMKTRGTKFFVEDFEEEIWENDWDSADWDTPYDSYDY